MVKSRRADVLSALYDQFDVPLEPAKNPELLETIQPVVDVSRPSKIPYGDWRGLGVSPSGTLVAAVEGRRFVVTHVSIAVRNTVATAGSISRVSVAINGNTVSLLVVPLVPNVASSDHAEVSTEVVCDVNTSVEGAVDAAFAYSSMNVAGYYING